MPTLGLSVANDIANAILTAFEKKDALSQTTQDKPLLRILRAKQEAMPGGKDNISIPVQGKFMSDTAGFLSGFSQDDQLSFTQGQDILRVAYPWRQQHAGLIITDTELLQDGITLTDDNKTSDKPGAETVRIVKSLFKNRIANFYESWARGMNNILWRDGSQDAKVIPGLLSILTDSPTTGTTGGLDRGVYTFWRHRFNVGLATSPANSTLTNFLRSEFIQLRRYGGKPNKALCGSAFLDALRQEVQAKGYYTQNNFSGKGATNISMADLMLDNVAFEYDPTLDDLGFSKRVYVFDDSHIKLRPISGEDNKVWNPHRPYNYMIYLKSMTWAGALAADQLNCNAVYGIA